MITLVSSNNNRVLTYVINIDRIVQYSLPFRIRIRLTTHNCINIRLNHKFNPSIFQAFQAFNTVNRIVQPTNRELANTERWQNLARHPSQSTDTSGFDFKRGEKKEETRTNLVSALTIGAHDRKETSSNIFKVGRSGWRFREIARYWRIWKGCFQILSSIIAYFYLIRMIQKILLSWFRW